MFFYSKLLSCLKTTYFLTGAAVAIFVWILDPFIDAVFLQEGTINQLLFHPDTHEVFMRSVISSVILIFSFIISFLSMRSKQINEKLSFTQFAVDHANEAIYWVEPDAHVVYGNKLACNDLGYSKEELETLHVYDFNAEFPKEGWFEFWAELKEKKSITFETLHIKKDGTVFPVEISGNYLEYSGNDFALAFVRDITDRKEAEALLIKKERQLTESQAVARLGNWDMDLVSQRLDWSNETYKLFDKNPELYTPSFDEFARVVHPDDLETMLTVWNKTVAGSEEPYYLNIRLINDSGREWVMEAYARVERDKDNNVIRIYGTAQDVTDRKRAEDELQESHERFRASFADAAIGMALVSLDYRITEANQAFCEMLGYSKKELVEVSFKDITHPDDISKSLDYHQKLITGEIDHYHFDKRYLHKQGHEIWALLSVSLVRDTDAVPLYAIAQIQDITQRKQTDEQLSHQASHDALTGLINRREFERRAERMLLTSKQDNAEHALCFMDLDQFKVINDSCGHAAGDEMLRQLTEVLREAVRKRDTLARLGGDEFGILMEHCSLDNAHRVATSIQKVVQDYQFSWKGQSFRVGVSIGLVPITETMANLTELLKQADAACYMAKDMGRNRIHIYHGEDVDLTRRHGEMQWVTRLHRALEEDRFSLYVQPIVPLDNRTGKHYEFLIRLKDENGEIIPPGAFLPSAERYNLITQIDSWMIKHALTLLAENPDFFEQINFISINISGQSLADEHCLDFIITHLRETGIDGNKICFEITETTAISNLSTAIIFIKKLSRLGCQFALDDFGSGLSSFGYLKNLPVDYLKIDGMFVRDIVNDPISHAMVKSINEIGQVMGMQTIAEFVENDEIKGMLREIGVNYAQGYSIGKPLPFDELLAQSNKSTDINNPKD
jgi:diguanylate cyclase (GGDEF)-like protein/PAS domain S-box-containing protein